MVSKVLAIALCASTVGIAGFGEASANSFPQGLVVSSNPVDNTPYVMNGYVTAITTIGQKVFVGGTFTTVRNAANPTNLTRNYIFAYDRNTGVIDTSFAPALNGVVEALEPATDGSGIFVGGSFSTVNGVSNYGIAKLDPNGGAMVPGFSARTAGKVRDLAVHGNSVYLGGDIWAVNGFQRRRLAAINATTGAVLQNFTVGTTAPRISTDWVAELDVSPDGSEMVIIGNFLEVNGLPRKQIARIDLTGQQATVMDWSTEQYGSTCNTVFWTYTRDVEYSLDGDFFVVATTGGPYTGTLCDTAARWSTAATGSNVKEEWADWSGGDTLTAVAISDVAVYIGGHQRWMNNHLGRDQAQPGAVSRPGIAALDIENGVPLTWNPGRDPGTAVWDLHLSDRGLYVGSDTDLIGGEYHPKLAQFPLGGGSAVPEIEPATLPATTYTGETGTTLTKRSFDGSSFGTSSVVGGAPINWAGVSDAFFESGKLYYIEGGALKSRTFDGLTFGPALAEPSWTTWPSVTASTWNGGKLYYVESTNSSLKFRYFSLESGIVGSQTFTMTTGITWSNIAAMDFLDGDLYYAKTDGNLWAVEVNQAGVPVNGTQRVVSGPAVGDGQNWNDASLYFVNHPDTVPTVSLIAPANGSTVAGTVAVSANAFDSEGISQVEFFADGTSVGVDSNGGDGWGIGWDSTTAPDGATDLSATVTDTAGQTASASVTITVDNLGPSVSLTAPAAGATVSGPFVNVSATAADAVGLTQVEFLVDGISIGVDTNGGNGWSATWDTTSHAGGPATVTATATDTANKTATDSVSVTVDNSSPGTVAMVVANPSSLIAGETAVRNRLTNAGFSVTLIDDNVVTAADANGTAFVFVSSTVGNVVGAKLRNVPQPVWMAKPYLLDDMLMTGPVADVDYGSVSSASIVITNAAHPLAAGQSGTVAITTSSHGKSFGLPGAAADVVATASGKPTTFVYQAGDQLVGGSTADGCRLTSSVFQNGPASFTAAGWTMFDAAADYAAANCQA